MFLHSLDFHASVVSFEICVLQIDDFFIQYNICLYD